jgi:ANTAR domain
LEDLQFDLGEGPCVDSVRARGPVLEADLAGAGFGRWPAYAPAAYQLGARGVFAFPLHVGAVSVGALDIYQDRSLPMLHAAVASALVFADIAMDMLVHGQAEASAGEVESDLEGLLALRVEVYQAQGMVMIDLGVTLAEAMALLRAHAFTEGRPLGRVARDVVAGTLRLEP